MSEHDDRELDSASEADDGENRENENAGDPCEFTPSDDARQVVARSDEATRRVGLPVVLPHAYWQNGREESGSRSWAGFFLRRSTAAVALGLAVAALGGTTFVIVDHRQQATLLAARAQENAALAETVSALNSRLQAIETAKGRDELAELRRSVGDMKTAAVTSRELSAAIAQLSQRVEKLDREQGAKLDKLGERVAREASARTAERSTRPDRPETKPAPSATPPAPAQPPKFGANVSMDPTGSIERSRQVLRGYVVLGAQNDIALLGGRDGERAVRAGDYLPGAGRVERVERQGPNWVVVTDQGVIGSAYAAPD